MKRKLSMSASRGAAVVAVTLASLAFVGCTTTAPKDQATASQQRSDINTSANATLSRLYKSAPNARSLEGAKIQKTGL